MSHDFKICLGSEWEQEFTESAHYSECVNAKDTAKISLTVLFIHV